MYKFCNNCGKKIEEEIEVCPNCNSLNLKKTNINSKEQFKNKKDYLLLAFIVVFLVVVCVFSFKNFFKEKKEREKLQMAYNACLKTKCSQKFGGSRYSYLSTGKCYNEGAYLIDKYTAKKNVSQNEYSVSYLGIENECKKEVGMTK